MSALFVFLGAFTYGIVYTVWLKRRSTWNIVIGGLAGSFAVLAGAAAVDPTPQVVPVVLAIVLFLWTPPHFWSLAAAKGEDYARAGVPMLPVVAPAYAWTLAILTHTVALVRLVAGPALVRQGPVLRPRRRHRRRVFHREERRALSQADQGRGDEEFLCLARAAIAAGRWRAARRRSGKLSMTGRAHAKAFALAACALASALVLSPQREAAAERLDPSSSSAAQRGGGRAHARRLYPDGLDGAPLSLRALRGKPLVISLVYTACSSVCPTVDPAPDHRRSPTPGASSGPTGSTC